MNKNTRTLLITVISFVVAMTIVAVAYNVLKKNAPAVSFKPTLAIEQQEPEVVKPVVASSEQQAPALEQQDSSFAVAETTEPVATPEVSKAVAEPQEEKGPMMPNLPFTRLDGTVTSVAEIRGDKPMIINYFASWCPPCKQELPHFQKAFDEYGDQISFVFLDALDGQRETLKTINAFIKSFPFTGPVFYDDGMFAAVFQTNSLPTTVFIDKEGRVVNGYLGFVAEEVLYANIASLLD